MQLASERSTVYVVDDDASLCFALGKLFRSVGLHSRTYVSAREFLEATSGELAGCLVLDVRLPGLSGLDLQGQLDGLGIHLPVVVITGHADIKMSVRAMKAGAVDFLPKPFGDQDLLDAVMAAIDRDCRRRLKDANVSRIRDRFGTLSQREQQVMMLVTAGKMNKQVAADLSISVVTVKTYRGAAMRKMGARTLADLVRMADALRPATA
jgi:FixJ family two-component response regulator